MFIVIIFLFSGHAATTSAVFMQTPRSHLLHPAVCLHSFLNSQFFCQTKCSISAFQPVLARLPSAVSLPFYICLEVEVEQKLAVLPPHVYFCLFSQLWVPLQMSGPRNKEPIFVDLHPRFPSLHYNVCLFILFPKNL